MDRLQGLAQLLRRAALLSLGLHGLRGAEVALLESESLPEGLRHLAADVRLQAGEAFFDVANQAIDIHTEPVPPA